MYAFLQTQLCKDSSGQGRDPVLLTHCALCCSLYMCVVGLQAGNIANQREHLVLLLANAQMRLKPGLEASSEVRPLQRQVLPSCCITNLSNGDPSCCVLPSSMALQQFEMRSNALFVSMWRGAG